MVGVLNGGSLGLLYGFYTGSIRASGIGVLQLSISWSGFPSLRPIFGSSLIILLM